MANWHSLSGLTIHGRVMLANAMIYSIPRYWMQSSRPPDRFIEGLESDVYHLLSDRGPGSEVQTLAA
eukprot:scaffold18400_cov146-Isochrysis_galbana.AAC.1